MQTYSKWGPNYSVEFNIKFKNNPQGNGIYNILHITELDSIGSDHNLLVSVINGKLHISANNNKFIYDDQFELGKDYNIVIEQTSKFPFKYFHDTIHIKTKTKI